MYKKANIGTNKLYIEELKQYFEDVDSFNTRDIAGFYRKYELELKPTTLNWRIYELVVKGVLERIGRGSFKIGKNKYFVPGLDHKIKSIHNKIRSELPFVEFCVWNTSLLNEFTLHTSDKHFTLVEVEKDSAESVSLLLKEKNNNIFFNPNSEILEQYIFNIFNPTIVKFLVSESPLQKVKKYSTVTLEKVLVDLYCDKDLFSFYQGREKSIIFKEAYEKYTVNNSKLLRYAARRGKKEEIENYINQIIGKYL
ncbi:MAG: hypothetical protein PHO94_01265 [Petrimonas sp.]|nr:hypothetical protein [Petrimonas sp.]